MGFGTLGITYPTGHGDPDTPNNPKMANYTFLSSWSTSALTPDQTTGQGPDPRAQDPKVCTFYIKDAPQDPILMTQDTISVNLL